MKATRVRLFFVPVLFFSLACSGFAQLDHRLIKSNADDPHGSMQVKLEVLNLYDGLPGGPASSSLISVGHHLGRQTSVRKDSSGKVVYLRTVEGQIRWAGQRSCFLDSLGEAL